MEQTELLWALLDAGLKGNGLEWIDGIKKLNLHSVDWSKRHVADGYTVLVQCVNILLRDPSVERALFPIIQKLIGHGASVSQKCATGEWGFSTDGVTDKIT
ncbi:unnamed protein product [Durusdinium trenchii]|uniref:Uncharacterized protein n=1 Tax=Durusdinium trenchii TaxID=1381693 RepID=A0ABP0JJ94_9DINO